MNVVKFDPAKVSPVEIKSGCNTPDDVIRSQVTENIRRQLPQVQPFNKNGQTALLVCGGPSLELTERELIEAYWARPMPYSRPRAADP